MPSICEKIISWIVAFLVNFIDLHFSFTAAGSRRNLYNNRMAKDNKKAVSPVEKRPLLSLSYCYWMGRRAEAHQPHY